MFPFANGFLLICLGATRLFNDLLSTAHLGGNTCVALPARSAEGGAF